MPTRLGDTLSWEVIIITQASKTGIERIVLFLVINLIHKINLCAICSNVSFFMGNWIECNVCCSLALGWPHRCILWRESFGVDPESHWCQVCLHPCVKLEGTDDETRRCWGERWIWGWVADWASILPRWFLFSYSSYQINHSSLGGLAWSCWEHLKLTIHTASGWQWDSRVPLWLLNLQLSWLVVQAWTGLTSLPFLIH